MNEPRRYPDKLEIVPLAKPPNATIRVPGSKSITNRALVLAALYGDRTGCELNGALRCEDTEVMVACLARLGFDVQVQWPDETVVVRSSSDSIIPVTDADLFVANSGTTMRFLTALVSLGLGRYRLDGSERMRERPIEDLLIGLRQLGVRSAETERHNGFPPVVIKASGLQGGPIRMRGDLSSQFLSSVLMVAPLARAEVSIEIDGPLISEPYVEMTARMVEGFGAVESEAISDEDRPIRVPLGPAHSISSYRIEPDATAAGYFFAAAAITGGAVRVDGIVSHSLQGDVSFVSVLEELGCKSAWDDGGTTVAGAELNGIDVDMNDISDTVMTLAAVACFTGGPTNILNVAHIRHKESDRIAAMATELRKVGAEVKEFHDGMRITPRPLHGAVIDTYNDHRIAMSMALIGLKVPGIVIKNPGCVAKTYPGFWDDLEKLREDN